MFGSCVDEVFDHGCSESLIHAFVFHLAQQAKQVVEVLQSVFVVNAVVDQIAFVELYIVLKLLADWWASDRGEEIGTELGLIWTYYQTAPLFE